MPFNFNSDGSLAPFNIFQIEAMGIGSLGVDDGTYPQFTREVNQNTARAEYLVNSDQLDNFFCFMLGGGARYYTGSEYALSRLLPQDMTYQGVTYPNFSAIKIEGTTGHKFTEDDNDSNSYPIPNYQQHRVRVLFQQVPYNLLDDDDTAQNETQRYVQQLPTQSQVEYLSLPGAVANYVGYPGSVADTNPDGLPVPYGAGFPTSSSIISKKWWRLPYNCWGQGTDLYATIYGDIPSQIEGLVGTVNQNDFLGYPSGTLLWLAPEEELVMDQTQGLAWNLTYKWLYKVQGHNFFYYFPSGGIAGNGAGWYFVRVDGESGPSAFIQPGNPISKGQCFFATGLFSTGFLV
jgi:hypothetical protein